MSSGFTKGFTKALAAAMLFLALASTAVAQVQITAYGYGYAPTSTAAYDVAYLEADRALRNECYGYVSNEYVMLYNVNWTGWTWAAQVQLGGYCN